MSLLDHALDYHRRGWTVVPLWPGQKSPRVDWAEFATRRPTEDEIRHWWAMWPNANVGAVTGKDFVVVDVDSYKGKTNPRVWYEKAPTEMIARSARGGFHLYYKMPSFDVRSRVVEEVGVDVRGDVSIIVLPPSIFEGKEYSWLRTGTMGSLPEKLFDEHDQSPGHHNDPKWVSDLWSGVGSGKRDDSATKLAGYLASKSIPKDIAFRMLLDWDKKNDPPLGERDIQKVVDSVYRGAARRANRGGVVIAEGTGATRHARPFALVSMFDFVARHGDHAQEWLIDDWLPAGSILMVLAAPGSYKTWLVYDLAVSIATGIPFLEQYAVNKTGPVFIVQQEDALPSIAGRLAEVTVAKMGIEFHDDPDDPERFEVPAAPFLPISIHEERLLNFDDEVVMKDFEAAIAAVRPRVVILDPLYSMASVEDFMARVGENMLHLKALRDKYGCAFVIVHHAKKDATGSRQDAWGSVFVNASREGGWQITKPDEINAPAQIDLRRHYKDGGEFPALSLTFDIGPGKYRVMQTEITVDPDAILAALAKGPLSEADVAQAVNEPKSRVAALLEQLESDGLVKKSRGKYSLVAGAD